MKVGHDVNLTDTDALGARISAAERARPSGTKRRPQGSPPPPAATRSAAPRSKFSIDAASLLRPALKRWPWLFIGTALGGALAFGLGSLLWHMTFTSATQLQKYDPPVFTEAFRPRPIDVPTLIGRLEDPAFLRRVGDHFNPHLPAGEVLGHMHINPERNSGLMTITATGRDAGMMTDLANAFARETVRFTQEEQKKEATEAESYNAQNLAEAERQLAEAQKNMPTIAEGGSDHDGGGTVLAGSEEPNHNEDQIKAARAELSKLLAIYTDAHPKVKQQRALIAALETEAQTGVSAAKARAAAASAAAAKDGTATGDQPAHRVVSRDEFEIALFNLRQAENMRMQYVLRKQQIEQFEKNPPGAFRITVPASGETLSINRPFVKIALLTALGAILGLTFSATQILFRELLDTRLKTPEDVTRVTELPVIATLGDLRQMSIAAREDWAFRTWIALQDRLAFSPNHGLICGITSSRPGDGRSSWIGLLAGAARKCGFRVLTIATKPTADAAVNADESMASTMDAGVAADGVDVPMAEPMTNGHAVNGTNGHDAAFAANGAAATGSTINGATHVGSALPRHSEIAPFRSVTAESEFTAMTASALFTPAQVTEKLMGPESDPLVHIPLPGWTWNLERRKQWQGALAVWRKIENVVILVELPPASVPEAVLLASNLPNILWLVESGKSDAVETRAQLETLRHARCNLVGAVINRAMSTFTNGKLARWMNCIMLLGALGLVAPRMLAQEAPVATPAAFSVVSPAQRAEWQRHLTLGPGDTVSLALYGEPDLALKDVPIGPDGRLSFLEAHDVVAAGLTVDELRDRLNQELGKFRREPQVIVVPTAFKSKKYYLLGKVSERGVFTLDRPITLLEAVAKARGMETGMSSDRSLIELADLSHSFVARGGRKLPVDFEKLFENGDLSQNIALEPNDYIYFPAAEQKEVYVLGAVMQPGAYGYTSATGSLGAIAARGGFSEYAWRNRLLVIRGSMDHPQTFVIDSAQVLTGQAKDVELQPHDIVFVSKRPWARAEELLDEAATAFVTSAVVTWTGLHVDTQLHR